MTNITAEQLGVPCGAQPATGSVLVSREAELSALEQCPWLLAFDGRPLLRGRAYDAVKRLTDVVFSMLALVVALPVFLACALAVKIESPGGPVLFVQERSGRHGKRFKLLKLRTMVPNAEELKESLRHLNQRRWPDFKIENDPRITRTGRFLRTTSLDELPQLLNVLRGDMSLVGPRPISLVAASHLPWQTERFDVRPGLTGLWQVGGRTSTSFLERVRLDIAYIERRRLSLDLVILVRTVPTVLFRRGSV